MKDFTIIEEHLSLLKKYLNTDISHEQFQTDFMHCGKDNLGISNKLYGITQELFYDVEEFCIYPELRDEEEIDEEGLLQSAKIAMQRLEEYKKELEKKVKKQKF